MPFDNNLFDKNNIITLHSEENSKTRNCQTQKQSLASFVLASKIEIVDFVLPVLVFPALSPKISNLKLFLKIILSSHYYVFIEGCVMI